MSLRRNISQASEEDEGEINLTPMLDVVFIMLIFFIVTATFIKEAGIDVDRPLAKTAGEQRGASILIAISAGNDVWIDRRKVKPEAVKPAVERLLAENPEGEVVIQADAESQAEALLEVMAAVREAGANNIALSAEQY
jgi:biopolymer transport protein ExbD